MNQVGDRLKLLAEYRWLTVRQLSDLWETSEQMVRRRLRQLRAEGLVSTSTLVGAGQRGRPETVATLTAKGCRKFGLSPKQTASEALLAHQLLENRFRLRLLRKCRETTGLELRFRSSASPFCRDSQGKSLLSLSIPGQDGENRLLIPDAAYVVIGKGKGARTLHFLEVDRGTEPVASRSRPSRDLQAKLAGYRLIGQTGAWRRIAELLEVETESFSLVVLTTRTNWAGNGCEPKPVRREK